MENTERFKTLLNTHLEASYPNDTFEILDENIKTSFDNNIKKIKFTVKNTKSNQTQAISIELANEPIIIDDFQKNILNLDLKNEFEQLVGNLNLSYEVHINTHLNTSSQSAKYKTLADFENDSLSVNGKKQLDLWVDLIVYMDTIDTVSVKPFLTELLSSKIYQFFGYNTFILFVKKEQKVKFKELLTKYFDGLKNTGENQEELLNQIMLLEIHIAPANSFHIADEDELRTSLFAFFRDYQELDKRINLEKE